MVGSDKYDSKIGIFIGHSDELPDCLSPQRRIFNS